VTAPHKRKLIEVALPLEAINREAAREKSIRHGHPSTLHLWWARRPLAACRAVLFAQLVDDPSSRPEEFPTVEEQDAERQRLFALLEELVKWENSTNETVLRAARAEIRRSCGDNPPPIVDPFCGGGSIPLEAQRLGLEAHASDLNPVAVLITKALIEIPPKWAGCPPVHPDAERRTTWTGAHGLAEDVRRYGAWMRDEAERRIGHLYPEATLPNGAKATVIAWLWTRTVPCPNPACRATMPLARSFWLGKKKGKEAWVRPVVDGRAVRFEIGRGPQGPALDGTVGRTGAVCLVCSSPVPLTHIRAEGKAGRMGRQLMAVVAEGRRERIYLPPTEEQARAADTSRPSDVPDDELPHNPRDFKTPNYGMRTFADLFTNRQLVALTTFSDLVTEARDRVTKDAEAARLSSHEVEAYADAVATYLALGTSRLADIQNALCRWENTKTQVRNLFTRQAIPMIWDFAEAGLFSEAAGDFGVSLRTLARVVEQQQGCQRATVAADDARQDGRGLEVVSTDPPYYDNIGYADLSDFFYVWLRRSLRDVYPGLFGTLLTPKSDELVATPYRFGGSKEVADRHFEQGFVHTFATIRERHRLDVPMTVFYAFKQAESEAGTAELASTGWETMLTGMLQAGFEVMATWPLRTELGNRMLASGTNTLASSIVLACRPRAVDAGMTDRRGFLATLRAELPTALRNMQQGNIAPVDLAQAAIGPGMAVFSRYSRVIEPSGESMRVRTALGIINSVLDEVLAEQEGEFDADTRWAVKWFEQNGFEEAPYGVAEVLAKATNSAVNALVDAGIVAARGGKVRLLRRDEMPVAWDPAADSRVPVWEVTQHLIKRLEEGGESGAADLLRQVGGIGDVARDLAYRLYTICERRKWAKDALAFNALVTSWPEISRQAGMAPTPEQAVQATLV
jgi:putative DNA methylase